MLFVSQIKSVCDQCLGRQIFLAECQLAEMQEMRFPLCFLSIWLIRAGLFNAYTSI
jgi:hypothetical protein